jgi:hypothetical protein
MAKPTVLPEWATSVSAVITEPALGVKQLGHQYSTRCPPGWLNWWQELVYDWTNWLSGTENGWKYIPLSTGWFDNSALVLPDVYWMPVFVAGSGLRWMQRYGAWEQDLYFPIDLHDVSEITRIEVICDPVEARTGTDRMGVQLLTGYTNGALSAIGSLVYDNGSADLQTIVVDTSTHGSFPVAVPNDITAWIRVKSGNDTTRAHYGDYVYDVKIKVKRRVAGVARPI